ncbi:MAG: M28 family peptidase [Candidatus Acidiferrales bacterium]|jgi:glutaminyl-peptide cyclotransferase
MIKSSVVLVASLFFASGCSSQPAGLGGSIAEAAATQSATPTKAPPVAPAPNSAAGFDAARAFEHVRRLVEIGPRPPGSDGIHAAQAYIVGQLKSFGCPVEEHDFHGSTALGDIAMKNIITKIPGKGKNIVLYATHYDTVRIPNFVGADDGGSGTGMMLEMARLFCGRKAESAFNVWIAFFDGEEAQGEWADKNSVQWTNTNSTFGSREMAASMALSGDLKRLKAMILADMIGPSDLKIKRENQSTQWLNDLIWKTAGRLGYGNVFVDESFSIGGDDHLSFIRRGVAACDLIDFDVASTYWHTPEDTLDKVDPRSIAIVGHVFVETLPELEKKFR